MQDEQFQKRLKTAIFIFLVVSALMGFYQGVADLILSNYFKEAYDATAQQRGLIEIPRELPGVVSLFVISAFAFLRDIKTAVIAQVFGVIGMVVMGVFHPSFGIMLIFLFIFSLGQHMSIPLGDSIGLSLTTRDTMGRVLGRFKSATMAFSMVSGLICFFGFSSGFFAFNTPVLIFLLCAGAFLAIGVLLLLMHSRIGADIESRTEVSKMVFRKEYTRYYVICSLFGCRKQLIYVYSPWVMIELLGFKADTMSMLGVIGSFVGIFFVPLVGKLIDSKGSRFTMIVEAGCFMGLYSIYFFLCRWIDGHSAAIAGVGLFLIYLLFISDRMTTQFYMVRSIYMKTVALREEDVTPSLSAGMALDHVFAIIAAFLCGIVWDAWGAQWVFVIAVALSAANMVAAYGIKKDAVVDRSSNRGS